MISFFLIGAIWVSPAIDDGPLEEKLLRDAMEKMISSKSTVGVVGGIIHRKKVFVAAAGKPTETNSQFALDSRSVFEIGSITKAFTGLLLADLIESGKARLDDPVDYYLPTGVRMPVRDGALITLEHLSTHRSGLPRLPDGMLFALFSDDPYKDYSPEKLFKYLPKTRLHEKPGTKYDYSNLGTGLLGCCLARKANKSYEQLLKERVLDPLQLSDTHIELKDAFKSRFVPGHNESLKPTVNWHFSDALAGAGALRSTVDDQLKFLQAHLDPQSISNPHLQRALLRCQKPISHAGPGMQIGLGWHILSETEKKEAIVWHNGGTGGYRSFVGFIPKHQLGIVLLTNSAKADPDTPGFEILHRIAPKKPTQK